MPRIKLRIGEPFDALLDRAAEVDRRFRAGEVPQTCDSDFGFSTWEDFACALKTEAPELADKLLTMPEGDRYAVFDTFAGQEILFQLWDRTKIDTSCPG